MPCSRTFSFSPRAIRRITASIPAIEVGESAAVLPEQLAVWSYQLAKGDADAATFNMVNAMLFRIHQSGHLAELSAESFAQVKTGLQIYKDKIRPHIGPAVPYYPLGLPDMTDPVSPISLGMRSPKSNFIAVWRLQGGDRVRIPVSGAMVKVLYPADLGIQLHPEDGGVTVVFPRKNGLHSHGVNRFPGQRQAPKGVPGRIVCRISVNGLLQALKPRSTATDR